jgi:hypothetical protein
MYKKYNNSKNVNVYYGSYQLKPQCIHIAVKA